MLNSIDEMNEKEKDLDKRFHEAVKMVSNPNLKFPPDIRLYFYAYYKRAMGSHIVRGRISEDNEENALVGGFKMNALFQVKNISVQTAKEKYIELAHQYINSEENKSVGSK